jgi:hypothetical protein
MLRALSGQAMTDVSARQCFLFVPAISFCREVYRLLQADCSIVPQVFNGTLFFQAGSRQLKRCCSANERRKGRLGPAEFR